MNLSASGGSQAAVMQMQHRMRLTVIVELSRTCVLVLIEAAQQIQDAEAGAWLLRLETG